MDDTINTTDYLALSHSRIETLVCPFHYAATYLWHIPAMPAEALIIGIAVHKALEERGLALQAGSQLDLAALEAILETAFLEALTEQDRDGLFTTERRADLWNRSRQLLQAFATQLPTHWEFLANEIPFRLLLDDRLLLRGRIDAIIASPAGRFLVDYKTASSFQSWTPAHVLLKDQATAYSLAIQTLPELQAYFPHGCQGIIFAVCAPIRQQFTIRTFVTQRTPADLDRYRQFLHMTADRLETYTQTNTWPALPNHFCRTCGHLWTCPEGQDSIHQRLAPTSHGL